MLTVQGQRRHPRPPGGIPAGSDSRVRGIHLGSRPEDAIPFAYTHFDCHPEPGHPYRTVTLLAAIAHILVDCQAAVGLDRFRWLLEGGHEETAFEELARHLVACGHAVYDGDVGFEVYNVDEVATPHQIRQALPADTSQHAHQARALRYPTEG